VLLEQQQIRAQLVKKATQDLQDIRVLAEMQRIRVQLVQQDKMDVLDRRDLKANQVLPVFKVTWV
jgi:hypothetical protein